jgi:hypothetical protein
MIRPPTLETPPGWLIVWVNQCSRRPKGFIQTWLVLMRTPGLAVRELGIGKLLAVQLTLGAAILSAMVHGPWALGLAISFLDTGIATAPAFLLIAAVSYMAGIAMALAAPGRKDGRRLMLALSLPVYWPRNRWRCCARFYDLVMCPHFWAKMPHGAGR